MMDVVTEIYDLVLPTYDFVDATYDDVSESYGNDTLSTIGVFEISNQKTRNIERFL